MTTPTNDATALPLRSLEARGITLKYEDSVITSGLDLRVPEGRITAIIGPNACGKSTLLRALSRLLKPSSGEILLDGKSIHRYQAKDLARRLGLLPQSSIAPFGIIVSDLVSRGRFPHQRMLQQWSDEDEEVVRGAMAATGITHLANRSVDELSGGQRQRVWLAMILAQDPRVLLLDEPTTYLDIAHQLEVLELCKRLNKAQSRTIVLVLHDLNQAARYADHLVVMRDGAIAASGAPSEVLSEELIAQVFGLRSMIIEDPHTGGPLVVPIGSVEQGGGT